MEIIASFDDRGAQELLTAFMLETGKSMLSVCITGGRVAARALGESTWPKTLEQGHAAVRTQIRRIYATAADAYNAIRDKAGTETADAFWASIYGAKRRDWKTAKAILAKHGGKMSGVPILKFDNGARHMKEKAKNDRGRIPKLKNFQMVVQNDTPSKKKGITPLDKYIMQRQAMVGYTQSAWYNCLRLLDGENKRSKRKGDFGPKETTKPFPKWVIRHKKNNLGEVMVSDMPERAGIVLKSKLPWAATALGDDGGGTERWIMQQARAQMDKYMRIAIVESIQAARKKA